MMLNISKQQMQIFDNNSMQMFEDEMIVHSQQFAPELSKVLGHKQLRIAIKRAISSAQQYQFSYRGPIRIYIEMTLMFGSDFNTDPQYPNFTNILNQSSDQMIRFDLLYQEVMHYLDTVSGNEGHNEKVALKKLCELNRDSLALNPENYGNKIVTELERIHPLKFSFVGQEAIKKLILNSKQIIKQHFLPSDGNSEFLLTAMQFFFGQGCCDDPLYPWIATTLKDDTMLNSDAKIIRLEKKAKTWANSVLANLD